MLPSTGYFKGINCPFYDSGLCERPYCHFRHVKKESLATTSNDGIESGAILQKLVSAAVQKVLQQTETSSTETTNQATSAKDFVEVNKVNSIQCKATYNPTPIAELNKINNTETESIDDVIEQRKRHIPVPYTPRKPTTLPIKRSIETNGSSKPFIYIPPPVKYTPGSTETVHLDPYTPKGTIESSEKYLPGSEKELQEYTPKESQAASKHNYVPSDKIKEKRVTKSKKKVLEYKPIKIGTKTEMPMVTYQPTPKALVPCFSSDEDEPDKKKPKQSNDLNGLDDLGPEFDILDQILDEEKLHQTGDSTNNENGNILANNFNDNKEPDKKYNDDLKQCTKSAEKHINMNIIDKGIEEKLSQKHEHKKVFQKYEEKKSKHDVKTSSSKHKEKRSSDKKSQVYKKSEKSVQPVKSEKSQVTEKSEKPQESVKSEHKEKSSTHSKSDKSNDSFKKSHKSSSKDKNREDRKEKSLEKKKHIDSKISKQILSKNVDRYSKHFKSSSSKHDSKREEKSSRELPKEKYKKRKEKELRSNDHSDNDSNINVDESVYNQNEEDLLEISESDEETIALECKRIFEEYVPTAKTTQSIEEINNSNQQDNTNENEYIPTKKRISRTADKNIKILPKAPLKPDYKVSAAHAMADRLAKIKEFHASRISLVTSVTDVPVSKTEQAKSIASFSTPTNSKIRIAHVPYASTMVNAKKIIKPTPTLKTELPSTSSTVIQTIKKGVQRVAHIPNEKFIDRPGVLEPLASKIPANIRSTYLNMMIDECLKIYLTACDAYARAQHEELTTSKKCSTVQIYKNSAVLTVSRLRKELQESNGIKKSGADCSAFQKIPHLLSGKTSNIGSWSIERKKMMDNAHEFTGAKFYSNIKKWVLTEQQLQDNGFPRPHVSGEKGRAIIYGQNKQIPPKGLIRTCCRCKKDYIVDKKGFPAVKEECIYHPNNKYRVRGEAKYQCCSQDSSSDGCCVAPCHVYEYVDFDNLKGFIKTMPPESKMDDYGVFSLDCEMCYTTHGLDLTRVTVINSECKVVYETFIKPLHPIIDYNTRYSGITEEHMLNVRTTLLEVQATLLSMFTSKTILVGHSLESDFKALKLIHDTVIDTSVLFPHKMGPPYKRALRNLSSEYLKKIIQNSVEGHDSAEDATVCMELLMFKLKEDLKTR